MLAKSLQVIHTVENSPANSTHFLLGLLTWKRIEVLLSASIFWRLVYVYTHIFTYSSTHKCTHVHVYAHMKSSFMFGNLNSDEKKTG